MFCGNCGKDIEDGIEFCPNCGKSPKGETTSDGNILSGNVNNFLNVGGILGFVKNTFRGSMGFILWVILIISSIGGGIIFYYIGLLSMGSRADKTGYVFGGLLLGAILGLLLIITIGGKIATIINMDVNITNINNEIKSLNNKIVSVLEEQNNLIKKLLEQNNTPKKSINGREDQKFNYAVAKAVKIHSGPELDSSVITTLTEGIHLKLLEKGQNYKINDIVAPLVKIQSENNILGWCFSQFLKKA